VDKDQTDDQCSQEKDNEEKQLTDQQNYKLGGLDKKKTEIKGLNQSLAKGEGKARSHAAAEEQYR